MHPFNYLILKPCFSERERDIHTHTHIYMSAEKKQNHFPRWYKVVGSLESGGWAAEILQVALCGPTRQGLFSLALQGVKL